MAQRPVEMPWQSQRSPGSRFTTIGMICAKRQSAGFAPMDARWPGIQEPLPRVLPW